MKISGFTMGRNVSKLYYPLRPAIESILPLVDEFVVALGAGDPDDNTRAQIEAIGSPKIRIIPTQWDLEKYPRGMENAHQTDLAMQACSGDWLFYLQADEVVHEDDLPAIEQQCRKYLDDPQVEGFVFDYLHFWGDYEHVHRTHNWYPREVRIVRNRPDIHSWRSAQSFRVMPDFDGLNYRRTENIRKLQVAAAHARIFHYGWVRPPQLMRHKQKALDTIHHGAQKVAAMAQHQAREWDYGPLHKLPRFQGSHPAAMKDWLKAFSWGHKLQYHGPRDPMRPPYKHERLKYRLLAFIEQKLLGGRTIGGVKNYRLVKRK